MTFEMLLKAPIAIYIRLFISLSHFPLSVIKCPRYINFLTCSIALPSIVIIAFGVTSFLVMAAQIVLLQYCNTLMTDDTQCFIRRFDEEVFYTPLFLKSPTFIIYFSFSFIGHYEALKYKKFPRYPSAI